MIQDFAKAVANAQAAIAAGSRDPYDYNVLAWYSAQQGDVAEAFARFKKALELAPDDPFTLINMASLFRQQGQLRDAVLHCDAAIRSNPQYCEAWLERGFVLAAGGSMAAAQTCYENVLTLDPDNPVAHGALAAIYARDGDAAQGRAHAERALMLDPANLQAASALARIQIEAKQFADAKALLETVLSKASEASEDRSIAYTLTGDAQDRLGEADFAFASYQLANNDFIALHAAKFTGQPPHRHFIDRIAADIQPVTVGCVEPVANAAVRHIFLMGYPRSGTTLVENILASLPDVIALEERPTLSRADRDFLAMPDGLQKFAMLEDVDLQSYRQAYWDYVNQSSGDVRQSTFVDMDPFKATRLPLIARLFPDSRILIMRRDPRDVVWSCFRTNFALSNAAMEFTTLESTAHHYAAMMSLIDTAVAELPLNIHIVDYQKLVTDFDETTRAMCDFCQLPWSETLRSFDATAKKRGVSTASAGQVRKGLYDGTRQWERYHEFLIPVMPILQPWIGKYGFE
jgi:tetratricopeptide (TPR) repeat protein